MSGLFFSSSYVSCNFTFHAMSMMVKVSEVERINKLVTLTQTGVTLLSIFVLCLRSDAQAAQMLLPDVDQTMTSA